MRLIFSGKSDIGRKRDINQDMIGMYYKDDTGLFVVADGMGGHANGEKASQMVVMQLADWWDSFSPIIYEYEFSKMISAVGQVIEYANKRIYEEYNQNGICGTTVVVLFIYQNCYGIIYAGDSRCYLGRCSKSLLLRGEKWEQITIDEVWENRSDLSRKERKMKNHPNRGKLVNAVGIGREIRCRIVTDIILPDTLFMLCTDGLYKFCAEKQLRDCMKKIKDRKSIERVIDKLIKEVYENGADDNISMIIIKYLQD